MNLQPVDEDYENRMISSEIDCNDGKGEALACHNVAEYYWYIKEDYERSKKIFERNCTEKDYAASCYYVGKLYLAGKTVPQDDSKAEYFFNRGCSKGNLVSCVHLGMLKQEQSQNYAKQPCKGDECSSIKQFAEKLAQEALGIFNKSCDLGDGQSCFIAGNYKLDRTRPDREPAKAIPKYVRGCELGHAPCCYNLAVMYKHGDTGVPPNAKEFEKYKELSNKLVKQFTNDGP